MAEMRKARDPLLSANELGVSISHCPFFREIEPRSVSTERVRFLRVTVERKVAEERAWIFRVWMELGAQDTFDAEDPLIDLRRCHHAEQWRNEVDPCRGPDVGEYS